MNTWIMRLAALATLAAALTVSLVACGGGGGGGTTTRNVQGIWTGTSTPNAGTAGTLEVQFTQSGVNVTGTARYVSAGKSYTGAFTGTVNGSNVTITITSGAIGTATLTASAAGNRISGSYTHTLNGVTETGTFLVTLQPGMVTPSVAGTFTGTSTLGNVTKALAFTVTQTDDTITVTGTQDTGVNQTTFTGSGVVIGNHLTFFSIYSGVNYNYFDGTITGTTISGTTYSPASNPQSGGVALNGMFTVTSAQPR